ncbi:CRISPR-associated endoribonuclease Cas6 [Salinibacter sp. 10B]|uniref:CRISPR-associated endoribonuclease Cas6 n=1 Tax=Salinibacter sp. 10B TaxID=1923971 RepID=UPI000CF475DF|nr:CRISPR-associated endoribonuclease Cas6 [Salinibacter sp. 10B]PQJ26845.1 CRISPR-associated endoribonuclease Cas6 [Salinibacter sp. 10B]
MRLNLTLSPNTDPVPFNHLHKLTGTLHKWLGSENDLHDGPSLYSVGWLKGGHGEDGALQFPDGVRWRLSFWEDGAAKTALEGILQDPSVFAGMRVVEAQQQTTPAFSGGYRFDVDAPVIARQRREDGSREYLIHDDERADDALTRTLRAKMKAAGLDLDPSEAQVRFDRGYKGADTKLATIEKGGHEIDHKGSVCPVIVEGPPEVSRFAWNVGVGELTGSGFGALK